jgi:DNA repair exonuclease SbcCD ATPase subunit
MKLNKITLSHFRSFKEKQTFNISYYAPGLYYVTGQNTIEPSLGANASGKSSLFEALTWCLFGKISTNLKAGNVASWGIGKSSSFVVCDFEEGQVARQWNPNKLNWNGSVIEQLNLEKLLNINFDSFLYSVFISQFSAKFFDLAPADKMAVFSSIMEDVVEKWAILSDRAKKRVNDTSALLTMRERELSHVQGALEGLRGINYKEQIEKFETDREKAIHGIKEEITALEDEIVYLQEKIKNIKIKLEVDERAYKIVTEAKNDLSNQISGQEKTYAITQADYDSLVLHETNLLDLIKKGEKVECPTCLQPVDPKLIADTIALNIGRKDKLRALELDTERALTVLKKELNSILNNEEELYNVIRDAKRDLLRIPKDIESKEGFIDELSNKLERKSKEANPYLSLEKSNNKKIKVYSRYKDYLQKEINLLQEDYEIFSFWTKGFKDIRLIAIENALKGFEVNINNELQKLGMPDWSVELSIEAETKSGSLKSGFTIIVKSPYHKEPVPFESFSGGEGQRLRLAGTLGLIDFIHSSRGSDWDIEIYDEPSQFLSEEGIKDLVETLYYRAATLNKRIFFIDQRNMKTFGEFKGIIKVVKEKGGSFIYEEVA